MAAEGAAVTVGRYVRFAVLNCSLFIVNCTLPRAGAKIGNYWIAVLSISETDIVFSADLFVDFITALAFF